MKTGTILVTGATGHQGGAVVRALLVGGHKVRALTRKPDGEAARVLAGKGAEVVRGDLDDAASLEKALAGAWGVFAVQNTWEAGVQGEEEQGKRLAELARRAGVAHYVYTSVASAHRRTGIPHFENKWRIEQTVRALSFPSYAILRPVFFMENFQGPFFKPGLDQGKLAVALHADTPLQMIAVDDIGAYGRLVFEQAAHFSGRELDIAGDELTMPEAARVLGDAMKKKLEFVAVPIEEVRKDSADYALMLEWFDRVGYDVHIRSRSRECGIPPKSLKSWAAERQGLATGP
ncbi:MAG TPA: NmrA/HSCARG family protein [Vicinamibacteria bacterium]